MAVQTSQIGVTPSSTLAYSVDEAAIHLRVSRRTVYTLIEVDAIPTFKVGSRRLISRKALEQFIAQRENAA